jgi:hypothetical protein
VKIDVQLLKDLIHEDYDGPEWEVMEDVTTGTWRWGIEKRIILRYGQVDEYVPSTFWGYTYQVETSNEDYRLTFVDEDIQVELWEAIAVPVVKIEYKRRKDGS